MFTSNCKRCPFFQKFTGGVLNHSKSCKLCPLGQTQLVFLVKSGHVPCTLRHSCHFTSLGTFV
ncbi:hypothetical protein Hanom_Chr11g00970221 [Helianthus anomalus]